MAHAIQTQPLRRTSRRWILWLAPVLSCALLMFWLCTSYYYRASIGLELLFAGIFAAVLALILAGWRQGWISPVFIYDLVRTARHGQQQSHRFLFAAFLALILFLTYADHIPGFDFARMPLSMTTSRKEVPKIAWSFVGKVLALQFVAVLLVTPAYVAGALPQEKQQRTLEFMLTTDLSDREIVLGILLSRLGNLSLLILTGLPILSVLEIVGGVPPQLVIVAFVLLFLNMLSIGSLSMLVSVYATQPAAAIFQSYLWIFLLTLGSTCCPLVNVASPIAAVAALLTVHGMDIGGSEALSLALVQGVAWHGFFSVAFCCWAISAFRAASLGYQPAPLPVAPSLINPPAHAGQLAKQDREVQGWGPGTLEYADVAPAYLEQRLAETGRRGRRVGEDAMLWKETGSLLTREQILSHFQPGLLVTFILIFGPLLAIHICMDQVRDHEPWEAVDVANVLLRVVTILLLCILLFTAAVRAASRMTREREQQTLETLRTTPLDASDILLAKFLGSMWDAWGVWVALPVIWAMGLLITALHAAALPLLAAATLVYAVFMVSLGLWLSTHLRTTLRAVLFMVLFALLFLTNIVNFMARASSPTFARGGQAVAWIERFYIHLASPVQVLWTLCFSSGSLLPKPGEESSLPDIVAAVIAVHFFLVLTALLWISMLRRLEAEKGPPPMPLAASRSSVAPASGDAIEREAASG